MEKTELLSKIKGSKTKIDWNELKWGSRVPKSFSDFGYSGDDLGNIKVVDSYGGEGMGDDYWMVIHFMDHDTFVQMDGWYTSYDGGYFDSDPYLVTPKEKTITVYEKI